MLVVLALKFKYSGKSEGQKFCSLCKTTYLEWGNEYNYWYFIPNVAIYFNSGFGITIEWLKINYGNFWKVLTFDDEDLIAKARYNKDNKDES